MIVKDFYFEDLKLKYFVGINQIRIDVGILKKLADKQTENDIIQFLIKLSEVIEKKFKNSMIQFFSSNFVIGLEHIFTSCYFVKKAFLKSTNISQKVNIEFLLYLAAQRQIKNAIEAFGVGLNDLNSGILSYCLISDIDNLNEINDEIIKSIKAKNMELNLNEMSLEKFNKLQEFFTISENQINVILNSYEINNINQIKTHNNLSHLFLALNELVYEKMSLLSLEKN